MKDDKEIMFCDFCIKADMDSDGNAFVKGCSTMKLYSIKKHEGSNNHLFAAKKHLNETNPKEAPALKAKLSLNKAIYTKLSILFKTVHAINVQGRPARDYLWLNELDESKGLDIGKRYTTNVNKCNEFATAIAEVHRCEICKHFESCNFVSVIVDGSLDSSFTENEIVYMQTCRTVMIHKLYLLFSSGTW